LRSRKLKIAIVFVYDAIRFEVWLSGQNKQVQTEYLKMVKDSSWDKYRIPSTTKGVDSIVEHILVDDPDFSDLDSLKKQVERGTLEFIKDVQDFLSKHQNHRV
jgi:hypothetical protein